jgi:glycogen debranching enzyme GlgX
MGLTSRRGDPEGCPLVSAPTIQGPGRPHVLGLSAVEGGTNAAVWAPQATTVTLCLLNADGGEHRLRLTECTNGVWHSELDRLPAGTRYGLRVDGPYEPEYGRRFDSNRILIDPYAKAVVRHGDWWAGVVIDEDFDWADDTPPAMPWTETVIYEAHVRGLTMRHPKVPPELRGTYAGLAHPATIEELLDLGVTAVELLPVHQFGTEPAVAARGLTNYWGYNTLAFFAPHGAYSSRGDAGAQVDEFKSMVRALHAAGLEVLLDVVYNHTGEGGPDDPTWSLRGLDDAAYYLHGDNGHYFDVTGVGNTVQANHPAAMRLIMDSLRYWVREMHVDGFRFDLASALARNGGGPNPNAPLLSAITQDPELREAKLIAEPWDASGEGYMLGRFPPGWCEWNDRFRDTVRDFWRGQSGGVNDLAYRLSGSSDLYADDGRHPLSSINLITAHDGFTLRDLVSYNDKHNEANLEDNRDGHDDNRSWNCGVEGETDDAEVIALRQRQAANLLATTLLSTGVPMITAGDERGKTQGGNNNAYCQDNEISWIDWTPDPRWSHLTELTRDLLTLRADHPVLRQRHFFEGEPVDATGQKDLAWFHPEGRELTDDDWADGGLASLGMFLSGAHLDDASFLVLLHAGPDESAWSLPGQPWAESYEVVMDTGDVGTDRIDGGDDLYVVGRSLVVLRATT